MKNQGLYDPKNEHDACGIGFVANIDGKKNHDIIKDGINILCKLEHRGAVGGDQKTGDGAGLMSQIPHKFFSKVCDFDLPKAGKYGVGFLFLPTAHEAKARELVEQVAMQEEADIIGWRNVPVNPDSLGTFAQKSIPSFWQIFLSYENLEGDALERRLYILRKCLENAAARTGWGIDDFYIPSLSSRTIIYKGMFVSAQFVSFYPDLDDKSFTSAMAMVHQRYSTNTFPSWALAQPFHFIAHNGEINTLRGNINKMQDSESTMASPYFKDELPKIFPIINPDASDSASFDNCFELLTMCGRPMEHAMIMMVPEAFGLKHHMSRDKRAFYEYHMTLMDPWDGPASLTFCDGIKIGAYLDRNGLRPGRYTITKQGKVVLSSETGVLDIKPADVREKGRLAPGKMFLIDTERQRVIKDNEIKAAIARWKPYRRWLEQNKIELKGLFQVPGQVKLDKENLLKRQIAFGYTLDDLKMIILPMVKNAQEPIGSMGNDTALAVLSKKPQLLYHYFKQRFAQVTNPPIDPYRENLVMSLSSWVGRQRNLLVETPKHCRQLKLTHPILTNDDIDRLKRSKIDGFSVTSAAMTYHCDSGSLESGLIQLGLEVEKKVDEGYSMVILSDRGMSEKNVPIPALLAISSVHHHLVRQSKRHLTALVLETGEVREVHHFATLISYGASSINPYLVFETIMDLQDRGYISKTMSRSTASMHFITAVNKGLMKVMSKMGISTLRSYRNAQTFEALGLSETLVDKYFPGTSSQIAGIGLETIEKDTIKRHTTAFKDDHQDAQSALVSGGDYHYRRKGKQHLLSPEAIVYLQKAVRKSDYDAFKKYTEDINDTNRKICTLRGLLKLRKSKSIPLDEVEPIEHILKRFVTSAMSLGSISKEAHETMAIAMNRIGANSNSGEGGENEERYQPFANGDSAKSSIKQIASGRFGVTSHYLVNSKELQIKMAQGAKPGEGGQLPGFKVNEMIANVRHSTPGVMLISPPPHHDIYSIEDLAQLIFDLKCANPQARVSVKLVSEAGVGTVAAGVVKAKADMILISGGDGGTGASPLSSIKHAGSSWELGLAETQQTLLLNDLRHRVRIQIDGQLKTGRDVVIGALLGAEEFGFGTTALISLGCVMMRKCHLNTCPVGIATQDDRLRKRFRGKPEYVINFMRFIAMEVREYMAALGFKTFDEMVGQTQFLQVNKALDLYKSRGIDFSKLLSTPQVNANQSRCCSAKQTLDMSLVLDKGLIKKAAAALDSGKAVQLTRSIHNYNRSTGATLSSEVSKKYGAKGLPHDTIRVKFKGSAGQSFGAFLAHGITFELHGDANDYVGKGLSGGQIIIRSPGRATYLAHKNMIAGNVNLYGATSGEVFINGLVGERFCVRNSGAIAVVEGVGAHGCEYMTGGRVIVLGKTGVNFAAGMSGGIAYVLDENQLFDTHCNLEMVDIEPVNNAEDIQFLYTYIEKHREFTKSRLAADILKNWEDMLPYFVKVMPIEYRRALERITEQSSLNDDSVNLTEEVYN